MCKSFFYRLLYYFITIYLVMSFGFHCCTNNLYDVHAEVGYGLILVSTEDDQPSIQKSHPIDV